MIVIRHPERYDIYCWTDTPNPPESNDPDNWELIAADDSISDRDGPRMSGCFWGHVKPGCPGCFAQAKRGNARMTENDDSIYQIADEAEFSAYEQWTGGPPSEDMREHAQLAACYAVDIAIEKAARVAENFVGGYTANARTSETEQELILDPDGPWVLNMDVADAIRALNETDDGA